MTLTPAQRTALEQTGIRLLTGDALALRDPGMDAGNFRAGIALCPETTEEVQALVRVCRAEGIPIVPQGGRTGLAGGAASKPGQVIVMLDRMDRIHEIDPASRVAVVGAGVTLSALEERVRQHGLSLGIDLAARGSCTIGGMVATNAGGAEAFRNGTMRTRVLGLEAVLPDGSVLRDLKRVIKANEGYDIGQLLIGSEGTLGLVTAIALRLDPATGPCQTILASTPDAGAALRVFHALRDRLGPHLLSAEIMWDAYFRTTMAELGATDRFGHLPPGCQTLFDIAITAAEDGLDALEHLLQAGDIRDALISQSEAERRAMWQLREDSFLIDRAHPGGCWFDISIPLGQLDAFVAASTARMQAVAPGLRVFIMGHLGDGNLHYTVAGDSPVEHLYPEISAALYDGLTEIGGSFSAEHGIGTEKRGALAGLGDPTKRAAMRAIKSAIDPQGIMNPGKVI